MAATFRAFAVYVGSTSQGITKVGTFYEGNVKGQSNTEPLIFSDGVAHTQARGQAMASFSRYESVGKSNLNLIRRILDGEEITLVVGPIDGQLLSSTGRITDFEIKTTTKSGVTEGTFPFSGTEWTEV